MKKIWFLFNRSIFFYLFIGLFVFFTVKWHTIAKNRQKYLLGLFVNGGMKNYNEGILYFETLIDGNPKEANGYAGLAACYFNLGRLEKASELYQKALLLDPQSKTIKSQLSVVEQKVLEKKLSQ